MAKVKHTQGRVEDSVNALIALTPPSAYHSCFNITWHFIKSEYAPFPINPFLINA